MPSRKHFFLEWLRSGKTFFGRFSGAKTHANAILLRFVGLIQCFLSLFVKFLVCICDQNPHDKCQRKLYFVQKCCEVADVLEKCLQKWFTLLLISVFYSLNFNHTHKKEYLYYTNTFLNIFPITFPPTLALFQPVSQHEFKHSNHNKTLKSKNIGQTWSKSVTIAGKFMWFFDCGSLIDIVAVPSCSKRMNKIPTIQILWLALLWMLSTLF